MTAAAEMLRLINGYRISQAIHVAASLRLSDHLRDGARSVAELAAVTGADPESLQRLLRALAAAGVYEELPGGEFRSTAMGDELRSDADRALGSWATFIGRPYHWQAWGVLGHSVQTGENAFGSLNGQSIWQYRAEHPQESEIFDAAMDSMSRYVTSAVLDAYDFGVFGTVADIGGGKGTLLADILVRHQKLRGILFDQPHVVQAAPALLQAAGVADRCDVVGGDIFASVPAEADAYLMKSVLHDWREKEAIAILRVCRKAMKPGAVVLVIERVLTGPPHTPAAIPTAFSDLNMLVGPGGQERSREEYESLFAAAGLRLARAVPTTGDVSILEATADRGATA